MKTQVYEELAPQVIELSEDGSVALCSGKHEFLPVSEEEDAKMKAERLQYLSNFEKHRPSELDPGIHGHYAIRVIVDDGRGYVWLGWAKDIRAIAKAGKSYGKAGKVWSRRKDVEVYILDTQDKLNKKVLYEHARCIHAELGSYTNIKTPAQSDDLKEYRDRVLSTAEKAGALADIRNDEELGAGVYCMAFPDGMLYIGQARDIANRMTTHYWHNSSQKYSESVTAHSRLYTHWKETGEPVVYVLTCRDSGYKQKERLYIHRLEPELNVNY